MATFLMHDLAILVELPDVDAGIRASIELQRATGIAFTTAPAIPADRFDTLVGGHP